MELPTIRVLNFKTEYKTVKDAVKEVEWVEYAPVSAIMTNRVWARVSELKPKETPGDDQRSNKRHAFMVHRWGMIEPAYNAWKAGQEIPVDGTPLGAWPLLTRDQGDALRRIGLRTVEDVASITDSTIAKIPLPNARELPKQAKLFLENTGRAAAAAEMATRDAKIAELEERLAAAMELLEQATAVKKKAA